MAEIWIHGKITNGGKKSYSRRDIFYRKGCERCDAFMIRGWKNGGGWKMKYGTRRGTRLLAPST